MATIKNAERHVRQGALLNLSAEDGLGITILLSGAHGIGKTTIIKTAAKKMGGSVIVVDGSTVKEGEICGLPIARKIGEDESEISFVPHAAINSIARAEKMYYNIAKTTGFCNGKYRLTEKGIEVTENGKVVEIIPERTEEEKVLDGVQNLFKFGENLSPEQKLEIIESGEIKLIFLFIDEINRTENQTMKELMNIILNKTVNGYKFPWYVSVVSAMNPCSQNSIYSTNEMDPAQADRFLKIKVEARFDEWVEYAMSKKINPDCVSALASNDSIFMYKNESLQDQDQQEPSPRSWEMVMHMHTYFESIVKSSRFFTDEEKSDEVMASDLGQLISGKVGSHAASQYFEAFNNKESMIRPEDILTGEAMKVPQTVVQKFARISQVRKKIVMETVIKYLAENFCKFEEGNKKGTDAGKKKFININEQLKEFIMEILDEATRLLFVKKVVNKGGKPVACEDGKLLYTKISKLFSAKMLEELGMLNKNMSEI